MDLAEIKRKFLKEKKQRSSEPFEDCKVQKTKATLVPMKHSGISSLGRIERSHLNFKDNK